MGLLGDIRRIRIAQETLAEEAAVQTAALCQMATALTAIAGEVPDEKEVTGIAVEPGEVKPQTSEE